jgi:hypothetical protein
MSAAIPPADVPMTTMNLGQFIFVMYHCCCRIQVFKSYQTGGHFFLTLPSSLNEGNEQNDLH